MIERIASCNSLWLFDTDRMAFCRLARGSDPASSVAASWRSYYALDADADTGGFHVALDEGRTRWLASWRHVDPCPHCADRPTSEVVIGPLTGRTSP